MPISRRLDGVVSVTQRVDAAIGRFDGSGFNPYAIPELKPRWRGRLHAWAFFVSVPLGFVLVGFVATEPSTRAVAGVYAASLTGLYAASALHHRYLGTPRGRPWMRWLDHSMIYLLIAGTFTPICFVTLHRWRGPVLGAMWIAAALGVGIKFTRWRRLRRTGGALYMVMGWAAVLAVPQFAHRLSLVALLLMGLGGLLYTFGAVILFRRWPDPNPAIFGYHEVWHACVVGASACHYAMVVLALARA